MLISNLFQPEIALYCEKRLCTHFSHGVCGDLSYDLSDHLFFYRLWHIRSFIHPSLDIIYRLSLDASENRLWYAQFQLYFTFLYKSRMILIIYHKYDKSFMENIPIPAFYSIRIPRNNILI